MRDKKKGWKSQPPSHLISMLNLHLIGPTNELAKEKRFAVPPPADENYFNFHPIDREKNTLTQLAIFLNPY